MDNYQINENTTLFPQILYQYLEIEYPNIPYIFTEGIVDKNMKMLVGEDSSTIILFVKRVNMKSRKEVSSYYSIAKRYCIYINNKTNDQIEDNMLDLWKKMPEEFNELFYFKYESNKIEDPTDYLESDKLKIYSKETKKRISRKISECEINLGKYLSYCIPKNSFNYIHCFFKTKFTYEPLDDEYINKLKKKAKKENGIENINKLSKYIKPVLETPDGKKLTTLINSSNSQDQKLEIAKFLLECYYDLLFNN